MDEATIKAVMAMGPEKAHAYWKKMIFVEGVPDDLAPFKQLLREYSNVPADEIDALLLRTRDQLWEVAKYPCIGRWGFANLRSTSGARFEAAAARLLAQPSTSPSTAGGEALLDIGCCIGQVLRQLAHRGVDPSRLYGTDLHSEFIAIGDQLFGDKGRGPTFVAGDMLDLDPGSESLCALDGTVTMVHAANFFHLFAWEDQVKSGVRIVRFLRPGTTDAVVFGRQIGSLRPREADAGRKRYLHDRESLQRLWDEVGGKTGTRWRVEVEVVEGVAVNLPFMGEEERYIRFGIYQMPWEGSLS